MKHRGQRLISAGRFRFEIVRSGRLALTPPLRSGSSPEDLTNYRGGNRGNDRR